MHIVEKKAPNSDLYRRIFVMYEHLYFVIFSLLHAVVLKVTPIITQNLNIQFPKTHNPEAQNPYT